MTTETKHYLTAIRARLEQLYEENPNDPALREQISDEVDWIEGKTITSNLNHLGRDQWQDALDTWAKENLPAESAGCITSWSDHIAEFICSRLAAEGQT